MICDFCEKRGLLKGIQMHISHAGTLEYLEDCNRKRLMFPPVLVCDFKCLEKWIRQFNKGHTGD